MKQGEEGISMVIMEAFANHLLMMGEEERPPVSSSSLQYAALIIPSN